MRLVLLDRPGLLLEPVLHAFSELLKVEPVPTLREFEICDNNLPA